MTATLKAIHAPEYETTLREWEKGSGAAGFLEELKLQGRTAEETSHLYNRVTRGQ